MGGTRLVAIHDPSNVVWICVPCHEDIESHRAQAYETGWLVRTGDDPAQVPLLYRDGSMRLLPGLDAAA